MGHARSDGSKQNKSLARNRKTCTGVAATKANACPRRFEGQANSGRASRSASFLTQRAHYPAARMPNATFSGVRWCALVEPQEDQHSDQRGHYPENKATAKRRWSAMVAPRAVNAHHHVHFRWLTATPAPVCAENLVRLI